MTNKQELLKDENYINIVAGIDKQVDYIDIKPYSHNIIALHLGRAAELFGNEVANDLIEEFELEQYGWSKVTEENI